MKAYNWYVFMMILMIIFEIFATANKFDALFFISVFGWFVFLMHSVMSLVYEYYR